MVCEVAGTLQGLLLQDLGDIGRVSLDQEHINNLLNPVACEKQITDYFCENSTAKSSSDPLKLRPVASWKRKDIGGSRAIFNQPKSPHIRWRYGSSHI